MTRARWIVAGFPAAAGDAAIHAPGRVTLAVSPIWGVVGRGTDMNKWISIAIVVVIVVVGYLYFTGDTAEQAPEAEPSAAPAEDAPASDGEADAGSSN